MSIFYSPKTALLDHISISNGFTTVANYRFTEEQVILSKPLPIEGTWMEETSDKNTFMKVSARPDKDFKGSTTITYNRLNIGDFIHFRPVRILPCHEPTTVHDIIPNIYYYFGIFLDPEEVHDDDVSLLVDGSGEVTVRMKEHAIIFTGEITFDVVSGGAFFSDHLAKNELDGLNYPVDNPNTEISALVYTYPFNMSEHRDLLLGVEEGILADDAAEEIATIFKNIDTNDLKGDWNSSYENNEWSLAGATVLYSGLNNLGFASNQSYKYLMQVKLRDGVTTPSGMFFIHYNDPFDPDAPEEL